MFDQFYRETLFYHQCQKNLNSILETPKIMYHYTSAEVLKSIIEGKCMYATHINFMNDWEEYKVGYETLTREIKCAVERHRADFEEKIGTRNLEIILEYFGEKCLDVTTYNSMSHRKKFEEYRACAMPEVYTISFCKEKDLLSQWAIYAKESGVAIEFDFTDFVFCDASLDEAEREKYTDSQWQEIKYYRNNHPHTISYSNQEMIEKLQQQIIEVVRLIKDPDFGADETIRRPTTLVRKIAELYSIVPYCKLDKFEAESEIRAAFMRLGYRIDKVEDREAYNYQTSVFYRTANHVLKPFLKIGWESKIPKLYPIKRIIVGPGNNQEVVFRGLIHFIENQKEDVIPNYKDWEAFSRPMVNETYMTCKGIIIEKSNIPYIF